MIHSSFLLFLTLKVIYLLQFEKKKLFLHGLDIQVSFLALQLEFYKSSFRPSSQKCLYIKKSTSGPWLYFIVLYKVPRKVHCLPPVRCSCFYFSFGGLFHQTMFHCSDPCVPFRLHLKFCGFNFH